MTTTFHYDSRSKKLHPVPTALVGLIRRDVWETEGLGFFCTTSLSSAEVAEHEFKATNGRLLRKHVQNSLADYSTEFLVGRWADSDMPFTAEELNAYLGR